MDRHNRLYLTTKLEPITKVIRQTMNIYTHAKLIPNLHDNSCTVKSPAVVRKPQ